jgi:hypothetical protein
MMMSGLKRRRLIMARSCPSENARAKTGVFITNKSQGTAAVQHLPELSPPASETHEASEATVDPKGCAPERMLPVSDSK